MTTTVCIGESEKMLDETTDAWIVQQIRVRQDDRRHICISVTIDEHDVRLRLATPPCPPSGLATRPLSARERHVVELWSRNALDAADVQADHVVVFLRQLSSFR